jgi:hypothetical protein
MTTELHPLTAKIYAFPAGGRAGLKPKPTQEEPRYAEAVCGSAWYHAAAIEEDEAACEWVAPVRPFTDRH